MIVNIRSNLKQEKNAGEILLNIFKVSFKKSTEMIYTIMISLKLKNDFLPLFHYS